MNEKRKYFVSELGLEIFELIINDKEIDDNIIKPKEDNNSSRKNAELM